jgi:hypothetical protein
MKTVVNPAVPRAVLLVGSMVLPATLPAAAAPVASLKNPVAAVPLGQNTATYTKRVNIISGELKTMLAGVWVHYEKWENLREDLAKYEKKGTVPDSLKSQNEGLRKALSTSMQDIRNNAKRLRSVSPVPVSLKKVDQKLVESSYELDVALDSLTAWADIPSHEMKLQASRQLRKASNSLSDALKKMNQLCEPAVKNKTFSED